MVERKVVCGRISFWLLISLRLLLAALLFTARYRDAKQGSLAVGDMVTVHRLGKDENGDLFQDGQMTLKGSKDDTAIITRIKDKQAGIKWKFDGEETAEGHVNDLFLIQLKRCSEPQG